MTILGPSKIIFSSFRKIYKKIRLWVVIDNSPVTTTGTMRVRTFRGAKIEVYILPSTTTFYYCVILFGLLNESMVFNRYSIVMLIVEVFGHNHTCKP